MIYFSIEKYATYKVHGWVNARTIRYVVASWESIKKCVMLCKIIIFLEQNFIFLNEFVKHPWLLMCVMPYFILELHSNKDIKQTMGAYIPFSCSWRYVSTYSTRYLNINIWISNHLQVNKCMIFIVHYPNLELKICLFRVLIWKYSFERKFFFL